MQQALNQPPPLENVKIFRSPLENVLSIAENYWTQFKKFGPLSENSSPPLVSQAAFGPGVQFFRRFTNRMFALPQRAQIKSIKQMKIFV